MKSLITLTLLLGSLGLFAQKFDGVWSDSSSTAFTNCYAVISSTPDSVFITHYLEFNGQPFVEHGKGIVKEDSLIYDVKVTTVIDGWSTAGTHKLILNKENNTLTGTYKDNKGNSGALTFKRLYPAVKD